VSSIYIRIGLAVVTLVHHCIIRRRTLYQSSMADSSNTSFQEDSVADRWVRYEDDWSGISDTKERRKVQNRRNQRILSMTLWLI
jgi:hypothetical protein